MKTKKKINSIFLILIILISFQSGVYNSNIGEKDENIDYDKIPQSSATINAYYQSVYSSSGWDYNTRVVSNDNSYAASMSGTVQYHMSNTIPTDGVATSLSYKIYAKKGGYGAGGAYITVSLYINGAYYAKGKTTLSTTEQIHTYTWTGSWTEAQVDAMRIRVVASSSGDWFALVDYLYCIQTYSVPSPPSAPTAVHTDETPCYDGTSDVDWTKPADATKYQLYECTTSGGTYYSIGSELGDVATTTISKTSEQTKYYKVKAGNDVGWSGLSTTYATITWDNPPTPTLSKPITETAYTDSNFDVERGSVGAYVDSYDWEVSINSGSFTDTSTSSEITWSYDPGSLDPGDTTFRFRLRVKNTAFTVYSDYGYSDTKTIIIIDSPDTPVCDTPQYTSPISISWNPTVTGATETNLQNSTNGVDFDDISGATSSPTSFSVLEGTYYFRVRASNVGATEYGSYVVINVNTPSDPGSPTCSSPDFDGDLEITWTSGTGSTSAILQISTDGSNFDDIPGETSSPTTLLNKVEGSYWFRVKSTNDIGISYSSISSEIIVSNPSPVIEFTDGNDIEFGGSTYLNFTITDPTSKSTMLYNLTYSYNGGSNITIRNNYSWTSGTEISYVFNLSDGLGSYNFFVIANDNVDHLNKTSINNFTINVLNENYPYFSNLVYSNFEYNTNDQNFTWIFIDNSTENPYYKIEYRKNEGEIQTPISSQSWISGEQNSFDLEFIKNSLGSYNFTITGYDGFTKSNSTSFFVNVTNLILPSFTDLTYQDFEYSDTGYNISFKIIDFSLNESENYYKIEYSKNGGEIQTAIESEFWNNNTINNLNLDFISEDLGLYEFNITAYDGFSGCNSTIFNVNITNLILPEFIDFDYTNVEYNAIGYSISWKNIDFSINGSKYYKVEYAKVGDSYSTLIESQNWVNNTLNSFSIDFINDEFGHTFNFNITAYDGLGGSNMTSISIEVVNNIGPVITGISSFTGEYGSDIVLSWYIYDYSSIGQYYTLNRTIDSIETTLLNETWESQNFGINGRNSFYFSDYLFQNSICLYNFTLYVFDGIGLSTNITFYVNITNSINPEITFINNTHIIEINESFDLEWKIEDPSHNISTYDLDYKKNNSAIQNLRNDIEWGSGDIFSFSLLDFGFTNETYNITFYVIANDNLGLLTNESFLLYVSNGIPIIFCNVSDSLFEYGNITDFEVKIYDSSINTTSIIVSYIYQENSTEILNSSWTSGEKFEFTDLDLSLGIYSFNINVSDGNGYVSESFTYEIVNTISPTISLENYDSIINRDNITNYITTLQWSISDVSQFDGKYSFYYEIDGNRTYAILNENFVSNYVFDLILSNLTKESQDIQFVIIAEDGLGLSTSVRFRITIESDETTIEIIESNQIANILIIIGFSIGLAFVFMKLYKKIK